MRLEDAVVFLKLSEVKNVRRASERLGLTQSAVSKVLQRLEVEFDTVLAVRGPEGLALTEDGLLLQKKAQALILSYESLQHEMHAAHSARQGHVRIGTIPALLQEKVLPMLVHLRRAQREMTFQLKVKVSDELIEMVSRGELDLAICFMPDAQVPNQLQCEKIARERYHVVARRGHPSTAKQPPSMAALAQCEWLLPAKTVGLRQWVDRSFATVGLPSPPTVIETDAATTLYSTLIRQSDIVTVFLSASLKSPAMEDLVELPFAGASSEQSLTLIFRRSAYLSPAARKLRNLIHKTFQKG